MARAASPAKCGAVGVWRWEITEDAADDLDGIWDYVYSYSGSVEQADALIDGFEELFNAMCRNPYARPVYQFPLGYVPAHEYRSANHGRYKAFYRIDESHEIVLIYRVRHIASDFTRVAL